MGAESSKTKAKRKTAAGTARNGHLPPQQYRNKLLDSLRTDTRIQLISRSSGHALQVVTGSDGQLILDGLGAVGVHFNNAIWTVKAYSYGVVSLHNQYNFLAVEHGKTYVKHYPPGERPGRETVFNCYTESYFGIESMWLESASEKCFVGILSDGSLNEAFWTGKDRVGEFSLKVLYQSRDQPNGTTILPEDLQIQPQLPATRQPKENGVNKAITRKASDSSLKPETLSRSSTSESTLRNGSTRAEHAFSASMAVYNSPNEAYNMVEKETKEGRYKKNPRLAAGPFQPVVANNAGPQDDLADLEEHVFEKKEDQLENGDAVMTFGHG